LIIGGVDTGIANTLFADGCTLGDRINAIARSARNHGDFVSGVAHLLNDLRNAAIISDVEKGIIQRAAARSSSN
jgi:hypothetical protein